MKVTKEKIEERQAYLIVETDEADMTPALADATRRLAQKTTIPGFRKGKAPTNLIEKYVGKSTILEEAIDRMLPQVYEQALKEQEIEPYAQPNVEITQLEPLAFKATVPLFPVVELGDYKDIRLEPLKLEVTDERIEAVMEQLRHQYATWEPVERPVQFDDMITADILGEVDEKPYIRKVGAQTQVVKDSISPAPGFAEQVVGMNKDEEKEFTLTFPEDYLNKDVAGKEGHFKVKISEIKEEKLPDVNDELAAQIDEKFKTVADLREEIVTSLTSQAEENMRMDLEERVINVAIQQSKIEYPPVTVTVETDRIMSEQQRQLQAAGRAMEDYLKNIGKTEEQMRSDLEPIARKNIQASLVLGKIAEEETIEVTEEDIQNGLKNMVKNVPEEQRDMYMQILDTPQTRQSLSSSLKTRKTIERLTDIAKTADDKPKTPEPSYGEGAPPLADPGESPTKEEEQTNESTQ